MSTRVHLTGKRLDTIPLTSPSLMRRLGEAAIVRIRRRTIAGRDRRNLPFRPYSEAYAKAKGRATGRHGVTLTLSGDMLNALTVTRVTRNTATIGFSR